MKDSKDIFDLFKNNENKLNQPPSDRAWDRLEARLDNHKANSNNSPAPQQAPRIIRKWLSMTGVLLVFVLAISALNLFYKNDSKATAMNQKSAAPQFVLEEIGLYSDQDNLRKDMDLYRKQLNRLNTNPILEGDPSKELRIQQKVFITMQIENEKRAKAENTNQKPRQIAAKKEMAKSSKLKTKTRAIASKDKPEMLASAPTASSSITMDKVLEEEDANLFEDATIEINTDMTVMDEVTTTSSAGMMMTESNVVSYGNDDYLAAMNAEVSSFNWLVGKWNSSSNNNSSTDAKKVAKVEAKASPKVQSIEEWTAVNSTTLSGTGYILSNGKKTTTESMLIAKKGETLYYTLTIQGQMPLEFKLKSFSSEQAIFENTELLFPKQVVLQKSEDGQNFSTRFQNGSLSELEEGLRTYFERRSALLNLKKSN